MALLINISCSNNKKSQWARVAGVEDSALHLVDGRAAPLQPSQQRVSLRHGEEGDIAGTAPSVGTLYPRTRLSSLHVTVTCRGGDAQGPGTGEEKQPLTACSVCPRRPRFSSVPGSALGFQANSLPLLVSQKRKLPHQSCACLRCSAPCRGAVEAALDLAQCSLGVPGRGAPCGQLPLAVLSLQPPAAASQPLLGMIRRTSGSV